MTRAARRHTWLAGLVGLAAALSACGSSATTTGVVTDAGGSKPDTSVRADAGRDAGGQPTDATSPRDVSPHVDSGTKADAGDASQPASDTGAGCGGGCPADYTCGTANGVPVCRAASGVPLFSHVFLILEENTTLSTLKSAMTSGGAPTFASYASKYATGSDYHGVSHPSLPNYIALTSGSDQGIGCDCHAEPGQGTCSALNCNLVLGGCTCSQSVPSLADQVESVHKTWGAFGESMGTACNLTDGTNYAVRHVPFLYYDDIQTNMSRCTSHVVDFSHFEVAAAPDFTYIAPNLTDDMHSPEPATATNIANGDKWIGPMVDTIVGSAAYTSGALFVIVWDEDDDSGGITGSDDPIPIFLLSPYAKSGGYVSAPKMDHYTLLATIEDGMGMPRLGKAGVPRTGFADTLSDYFPTK